MTLLVFALSSSFTVHAQESFPANEINFKEIIGSRNGDKSAAYILLGTGFVRAMRSDDVGLIVDNWLASHPNAQATPITATPMGKFGQLIYVLIEDGEDCLNISLIREGAFPGGVMTDSVDSFRALNLKLKKEEEPHRMMSEDRYNAFLKRVRAVEAEAKDRKNGIWGDKYKEMREQENIQ
ncbi:MAG TPA: hypothetical protein VMA30_02810 [Xanthobacteraceae bacterium]|nr:hypothetical protein [Xanthobacteraceae bacterium]